MSSKKNPTALRQETEQMRSKKPVYCKLCNDVGYHEFGYGCITRCYGPSHLPGRIRKVTKDKVSHRIDVVVALGMAALAAVKWGQREVLTPVGVPIVFENGVRVTNDAAFVSYVSTSGTGRPV